ncbi:hypothetical protein [Silicimonas sp. MF1-12-2]|uniref:hypothetical protein n=1 Tax=Silicimonas sp. MF1-12-2 TaxID=3384793 RepID=UPI0039B42305
MTIQRGDDRIFLSNLSGEIFAWDLQANTFSLIADTGVGLTDIAVAPDGRLYGISFTGLYEILLDSGTAHYIGALRSDTDLYFAVNTLTGANGFDISPDGVGRISSYNNSIVVTVDLDTGEVANTSGPVLGQVATSSGDIWYTSDNEYAVTTTNYTMVFAQPSLSGQRDIQVSSQFISGNNVYGLVGAPVSAGGIVEGTLLGFVGNTVYDLSPGNFTLGPGLASLPEIGTVSGATALRDGQGSTPPPPPPPEPESNEIAFTPAVAARLAKAAYLLDDEGNGQSMESSRDNLISPGSAEALQELLDMGLELVGSDLLPVNDSGGDDGLYLNENAAALLMKDDSSLFIAFRGTNSPFSVEDGAPNLLEVGAGVLADSLQLASSAYRFDLPKAQILTLLGNGLDFLSDNDLGPDQQHWIPRELHWNLFQELTEGIRTALQEQPWIDKVYVTGHSLGGAMVNYFMKEFQDGSFDGNQVSFQAISFASPGTNLDLFDGDDPRTVNFMTDGDALSYPEAFLDAPGQEKRIFFDVDNGIGQFLELTSATKAHDMGVYLGALKLAEEMGLSSVIENSPFFEANSLYVELAEYGGAYSAVNEPLQIGNLLGTDTIGRFPFAVLGGSAPDLIDLSDMGGSIIAGLAGNDILTGSLVGSDIFVFGPSSGTDSVTNFDPGLDWIDLSPFLQEGTDAVVQTRALTSGIQLLVNDEPVAVFSANLTDEDIISRIVTDADFFALV